MAAWAAAVCWESPPRGEDGSLALLIQKYDSSF